MKTIVTVILISLFGLSSHSQNLVPNPSFEENTQCPDSSSQLEIVVYWTAPSWHSTDYYHVCSTSGWYGVPQNWTSDNQYARTGDAYIGLCTYNNIHENAQVNLLDTLIAGTCYYIEFYVVKSEKSSYGINNISASFSGYELPSDSSQVYLNIPSHITKFGNPIIMDSINWVKISGIYEANGNESHMVIGNFESDSNTLADYVWGQGGIGCSYYFVDDVTVLPVDSVSGGFPVFAGNDTIVQPGWLFIGQELHGLDCNWYDSDNNQIASGISGLDVFIDSSTYFVVEQNLCGIITYDTIYVTLDTSNTALSENDSDLLIYPNPTNGQFEISSPVSIENIKVFSLDGTLLLERHGTSGLVDLSVFPSGTYIVQIRTTTSIITKRIVIT